MKDSFIRKVRHISFGEKQSELEIKSHKYKCLECFRYFNERFDGIMTKKRSSEQFRKEVTRKHHDGITQKNLANKLSLSSSTIEKWYQDYIFLEHQKINSFKCPRVLGIDEHFFSKKDGFATTLVDLSKHKVFDVKLGRTENSLKSYLNKLEGRSQVQVVLMDLSQTYRQIIKKYFKNAMIVADRFHVIRLINHHFMNTWKTFDPDGKYNRGLLSLMRRHLWKLKEEQKIKLNEYLNSIVGLKALYDFKQELNALMILKHQRADNCRKHISTFLFMISELQNSGFKAMRTLGNTLSEWREEIVRMWRFTKTNSITEGLHTKMEMISRRAFGFRNFENYRLRVKVHCGYAS